MPNEKTLRGIKEKRERERERWVEREITKEGDEITKQSQRRTKQTGQKAPPTQTNKEGAKSAHEERAAQSLGGGWRVKG